MLCFFRRVACRDFLLVKAIFSRPLAIKQREHDFINAFAAVLQAIPGTVAPHLNIGNVRAEKYR